MVSTRQSVLRYGLLGALAAFVLAGCATGDFGSVGSQGERRAEALVADGRYLDAAGLYIGLAGEASGTERDRLVLLAVENWLDGGDGRRARTAMGNIAPQDATPLRVLWSTNRAALALWEGKPDQALDILRPLAAEPLDTQRRIRVDSLRGDAWFQKNDPVRAVNLYLQLEAGLTDPRDIDASRQRLWAGLLVSNPQVMRTASQFTSSALIRGWLSLGALAVATGQQGIGWSNGLIGWRADYANHPAGSIIDTLDIREVGSFDYPRQVALLLPLSGRSGSLGDAIQNGFFAAYYRNNIGLGDSQQVRVYDVVGLGGAQAAYEQALADGAEFVVGPLLRNSVVALANRGILPAPMLTLNYLPENVARPPGMYQFALSPEDEARTAAQRAIADGRQRGVALVPNSDWGRRLLTSFTGEYETLGGTLLEYRYYQPTDQDFSFEIQNLMGLSLSVQRYQRLRANLGGGLQFDPRRRADAEFVFLAADAPVGRLLKSQLKFHYSGDLPVYSTSRIYALDGRSNSDLNGVGFADTPWTIAPQPQIADLPATFGEYWPAQQSLLQSRLHAMGYDAYLLINELYASDGLNIATLEGATGRLYLDESGRVRRQLPWAEFRSGEPVAMPASNDRMEQPDTPEMDEFFPPDGDGPLEFGDRTGAWTQGGGAP